MAPAIALDFEWRADSADGDRHAFPQRDEPGLPPPALCGLRWTVRFGEHGSRYCDSCLGTLRRILSGAQDALVHAELTNATGDMDALIAADAPAGAGDLVEAYRG